MTASWFMVVTTTMVMFTILFSKKKTKTINDTLITITNIGRNAYDIFISTV